ncbi:MAG: HEPN domain-containing protein [Chloroflexota bacterium]
MQIPEETRYRLRLADGFLQEAHEDIALRRWRSCVDNSQLATENAAKSVLALLGPVGRTHNPAVILRQAVERGDYPDFIHQKVERLAECAELLGPDVHVQSDYGDEAGGQTPWELFDQDAAQQALHLAEEAVLLSKEVFGGHAAV